VVNSKIGVLSGGEGRYLEIRLILESGAKFVLLDEPFNGISPLMFWMWPAIFISCTMGESFVTSDVKSESLLFLEFIELLSVVYSDKFLIR